MEVNVLPGKTTPPHKTIGTSPFAIPIVKAIATAANGLQNYTTAQPYDASVWA